MQEKPYLVPALCPCSTIQGCGNTLGALWLVGSFPFPSSPRTKYLRLLAFEPSLLASFDSFSWSTKRQHSSLSKIVVYFTDFSTSLNTCSSTTQPPRHSLAFLSLTEGFFARCWYWTIWSRIMGFLSESSSFHPYFYTQSFFSMNCL